MGVVHLRADLNVVFLILADKGVRVGVQLDATYVLSDARFFAI